MTIPAWSPGTLYQPGDLVTRLTAPPIVPEQVVNGDFEAGNVDWVAESVWEVTNAGAPYQGSWCGRFGNGGGSPVGNLISDTLVPVVPGQAIDGYAMVNTGSNSASHAGIQLGVSWFDEFDAFISQTLSVVTSGTGFAYVQIGWGFVAPPLAAKAQIFVRAYRNGNIGEIFVDNITWNYTAPTVPPGLVFRAVQADAGYSGTTEPVWPTSEGDTVVDNQVTWEAVIANRVVWQASPIMVSGDTEPVFGTIPGGVTPENTIGWKASSGRVEDSRCPNTAVVVLAASKVFAGDEDIIAFTATINPLDWSTRDDAGYLPFGLQTYGSQPVSAMGLYRGNLVAFNATGFQMWQVDQDPANMALLDSVPVSCTYPRTVQGIANDLIFLNAKGVRNISIAGASTNIQAGGVGEPIDSLVVAELRNRSIEPLGLYWPAAGQYWLIFENRAYILTINGASNRSWSRYEFPDSITDWTLDGNDLILRAGTLVWRMDADVTLDDTIYPETVFTSGGAP